MEKRYDDICGLSQPDCSVKLEITEEMEGPVYFYLYVKNYYQNHRL